MENSPLNKAHQLQRRAETLLRQKKFTECIETHKSAAEYLKEAATRTDNPRSIESINLQRAYHLKQMEALKIKELQYEQYQQSKKTVNKSKRDDVMNNEENLETIIFRTMDNHDSLLNILLSTDDDDKKVKSSVDEVKSTITVKKHQVNDATVIEELKLSNKNLRDAMKHYVDLVEEKNREVERLKSELYKLECEKNQVPVKNNGLRVITDSSGGTSPFVFSPCSELSPDVHEVKSFPALAPLDMPQFDFASFNKQLSLNNNL